MSSSVHCNDMKSISQSFGNWGPERSTESIGVMEKRQGPVSTPIQQTNLDALTGKRDASTNHVIRNL